MARAPTVPYRLLKLLRRRRMEAAASAALALALGFGFVTNTWMSSRASPTSDSSTSNSAVARVLTHSGHTWTPAVSPDGRKVAFAQLGFEGYGLWMADTGSGNTERLPIPLARGVNYLHWRGEHLFFARQDEPGGRFLLQRFSFSNRQVDSLAEPRMDWIVISPDGRRMAGVRNDQQRRESALIIANVDGTDERELGRRPREEAYLLPAWSPDGGTLACTVGNLGMIGQPMRIVAVDVARATERPLSRDGWTRALAKAWLPDGRGILVLGQKWGGKPLADSWLWRVDTQTGESRQVHPGPDELAGWALSVSADGRLAAAVRTRLAASLWVVPDADTSRAREIGAAAEAPRFLADGRLVFTGPDHFLWSAGVDGSNRIRLQRGFYKAVARDAGTVVFDAPARGVPQLWYADALGRNPVQLTHGPASMKPEISPDGQWVVYITAADGGLWKTALAGGHPTRLAPGYFSDPAISPDGEWVAVRSQPERNGRWLPALISARTGVIARTLSLPADADLWYIRFSPDGRALDLALSRNTPGNVWRWPLDGSPPVQLTHFASDELRSFEWSRDGRMLACLRGGWRGDIVLLSGGW